MRLTADLISKSPNFLNPLKERELDLRGNKLTVIENLGATQDRNDCIDLSDNQIAVFENFPLLSRLKMLMLSNNKIAKIAGGLGDVLPALETVILTNNKLANLSDIDTLAELQSLRRLCLWDNQITKKPHYRLYVIHKLPKLMQLDFKKIRENEREASVKMFGVSSKQASKPKSTGTMTSTTTSTASSSGSAASKANEDIQRKAERQAQEVAARERAKEIDQIKSAITTASSLAEVDRLTQALQTGGLPEQQQEGDSMHQ